MKDINEIIKKIDFYKEEIIAFTQNLIKINSVNGNETEVCKLIKEKLSEHGIKSKLVGNDKKRLNLIAKIEGRKHSKTLMLNGHTDTVPFGDLSKWKYKPLSGKFVDGKIYGRGAADMKGGIASVAFAAIALRELKIGLKGDLILTFTANEENPSSDKIVWTGVQYLLNKGIRADACIIAEPTDKISLGSRGVYRFELKTKGKSAHTGRTSVLGINAVTKMAKILLALEKIKMTYKPYKYFPKPRISPGTIIQGGISINIIPDECKALVDCRLSYGQTRELIRKDINRVISQLKKEDKELDVKIKELQYIPPAVINENHKIISVIKKNAEKILGYRPGLKVSGPAGDNNFLISAGIPTVIFGPKGENFHSENEYVIAKSILDTAKVFALAAVDFLGD